MVEHLYDASDAGVDVDLIVRAAEAGKAVFCEKPVSLDVSEVDRALTARPDLADAVADGRMSSVEAAEEIRQTLG